MGAFCEFWLGKPQSPKDSANLEFTKIKSRIPKQKSLRILEFLRQNLEFLEIASVALLPRNDGISAMTEF